jgi:hypothetical protein
LEIRKICVTWKAAVLAGLAILWIARPVCADSTGLETFQGTKGNYYRIPPGYLWENEEYEFTLLIPKGAEGCTDDGIISAHGPVIGPSRAPCLDVFKHPIVSIYAGYITEPTSRQTLIRRICDNHYVRKTTIVVDGQPFFRCWDRIDEPGDKNRYMNYSTFREPFLTEHLDIYIFCPTTGNCNRWIHKWQKIIFENLHIHWKRDGASKATGNTGKGHDK